MPKKTELSLVEKTIQQLNDLQKQVDDQKITIQYALDCLDKIKFDIQESAINWLYTTKNKTVE